jgi:hypothetical protein
VEGFDDLGIIFNMEKPVKQGRAHTPDMCIGLVGLRRTGQTLEDLNRGKKNFSLKMVVFEVGLNEDYEGETDPFPRPGRVFHV